MKAVVATFTLALVPLVHATGTRPPLEPCVDAFTPFESFGCFEDEPSTALIYRSPSDQNEMTIEQCTAECKGNGYRYAGLKYWGVCYCGSSLDVAKAPDAECHLPCSGNSNQICGSNNHLSVWEDPTFTKGPDDVTADDYEPLGCYSDDAAAGRALSYQLDVPGESFTTNACLNACKEHGFPYAGTEYGGECWCGTNLGVDNVQSDDGECDLPCLGDESMTCGGHSDLNLYYAKDLDSPQPCGYIPPTTTAAPTTTTTTVATTTAPVCTITQVIPPKCEYQCGKWCAPELPDWTDKNSCLNAAKTCALQLTSCFKTAGWPAVQQCFEFGKWCLQVKQFCSSGSDCGSGDRNKCSKKSCWNKYKPVNVKPPTTTTITTTCPTTVITTTTTKPATTSTSCPPEPTNICKQPTSDKYGYGPNKPVAGIPLPVVGCNDIKDDWVKNPFKFYTDADSRKCGSFSWSKRPNVCQEACEEQYDECKDTYVKSCDHGKGRRNKRDAEAEAELDSRTYSQLDRECASYDNKAEWWKTNSDSVKCWGKGGNSGYNAGLRCKAQYNDCLAVNKKVSPGESCKKWCDK